MKFIINNRNKLILGLLILAYLLFYLRFNIILSPTIIIALIKTITILSYLIIALIIIVLASSSLPRDVILIGLYIIILETIFLFVNGLNYHFVFWLSVLMITFLISLFLLLLSPKIKSIFIYIILFFLPFYLISQDIYISILVISLRLMK